MKKILIFLILLAGLSSLKAQTWRQYNLATGVTTTIPFTYTSTAGSDIKSGNRGILPDNFSSDTSRVFLPYDIINDPNAYPWRTVIKFNDVTGVLIDPYHVLTAGHAIEFHPYFQNILFMPGYENGNQPFSYAKAEYFYLLTDYSAGSAKDYAVIKLDRPVGALCGWNGYGYNSTNSYFTNKTVYNPSYPSAAPFDGKYLYNWKGILNGTYTEYFLSNRRGYGGMSGSPMYMNVNNDNIVYGILTYTGIRYNRITANKFDAITKIIDYNTPAQFDLIPLYTNISPKQVKSGTAPDLISFVLHNYSSENKINADITVSVYISADQTITATDDLLATYTYQKSINSKSSELISQTASLPVINKPAGDYYIGLIVSGDNNPANNTTKIQDVSKITITGGNNVTVKGRITSTQSGSGVHFVSLAGFPNETKTDYYGYYETTVPYGWSGTVTPTKDGYEFTNSSAGYSNITDTAVTNYTAAKKIFTISGYVKSPFAQTPLKNTKLTSLKGEPYTDENGFYSVSVFHGYSSSYVPSRSSLSFSPYSNTITNINSNNSLNFSGGFYISGRSYDDIGNLIENVLLQGFPGNNYTNQYGEYSVFVDSGWTGTVHAVKDSQSFLPAQRIYTNIAGPYDGEDYILKQQIVLNLKVLLGGAMYENSDTMKTTLNYKHYIPLTPPDSFGGNKSPFIYIKDKSESVSQNFLDSHPDIADWIIIELKSARDFSSLDTIAAFVRNDGQVISMTGENLITLKSELTPDSYYLVVRHRNHISIMSSNPVFLNSVSELYDFTLSPDSYYGSDAAMPLDNGKFAMFPGDADCNGTINVSDYRIFQNFSSLAKTGYLLSDFNLDGLLTGSDFNIFAPQNKKKIKTNVPETAPNKILK